MTAASIAREPDCPYLSDRAIALLSKLVFGKETALPESVDALFLFGVISGRGDLIKATTEYMGRSSQIIITGGIGFHHQNEQEPESLQIYSDLVQYLPQQVTVFAEHEYVPRYFGNNHPLSTNTHENVVHALPLIKELDIQSILFLFKAHACGRARLYFEKYLPGSELFQVGYTSAFSGETLHLTRENWWTIESYRKRVWGEFLRIKQYSGEGTLANPLWLQEMIKEIEQESE